MDLDRISLISGIIIKILVIFFLFVWGHKQVQFLAAFIVHGEIKFHKILGLIPKPLLASFIIVEIPICLLLMITIIIRYDSFHNVNEILKIVIIAIVVNAILAPYYRRFIKKDE